MPIAASKHPIAGAQARSTQNKLTFDHVEPLIQMSTITGIVASSAYQAHGRDRVRSPALTMPAASTPTANNTARSGVNLTSAAFNSATCGPKRPIVTTMAATSTTIARALIRRMISSSSGSRM